MVGEAFGRYRLLSLIGAGGMGKVYKAHDTVIDREVAIKILSAELAAEPGYRERFRREAQIAARLSEPHIIPVYDTGEFEDHLYLVMPVIDGIDVQELLKRDGPMSPQRAVHVIDQLASALDAAHAAGLVHRDVKPSNALMTGRDFAYLIDFGIARSLSATKLTRTGMVIGSCAYMAPERFNSSSGDASSDIYALACMLYECLSGEQPYPGDSFEQQIAGHLTLRPPRPSRTNPNIHRGFDEVIATGMAKRPEDRYPTASALATAAQQALAGRPSAVDHRPAVHDPAATRPRRAPGASAVHVAPRKPPPSPVAAAAPDQRPPRQTALLITLAVAVAALLGVGVVILALLKPSAPSDHSAASPTSTSASPPPVTVAQPAPTSAPVPQSAPPTSSTLAVQHVETPFGTVCQVEAQRVICPTCLQEATSTDAYPCGRPQPTIAVDPSGLVDHNPLFISNAALKHDLSDGDTLQVNGWTIAASGGWARFINDATGHGMAVAPQNFESF